MTDEFFNILIIILILLGCTYFYFNTIQMDTTPLREGLDLMGGSGSKTKSKSKSNSIYPTSSSSGSTENERDGASKYVDKLTHEVTKMKTGLNIATYRTDYENVSFTGGAGTTAAIANRPSESVFSTRFQLAF